MYNLTLIDNMVSEEKSYVMLTVCVSELSVSPGVLSRLPVGFLAYDQTTLGFI